MTNYSNLIEKYINILRQDPQSRVFAPLGEIYRKLGMYDKAVSSFESGLKYNPDYNLAIIGYTTCLIEMEDFHKAFSLLKPFYRQNGDNIKFLKNYAICADKTGNVDEAINSYKTVLFFNPKDKFAMEYVEKYEDRNIDVIKKQVPSFDLKNLESDSLNQWTQLSLIEKENLEPVEVEKPVVKEVIKENKPMFSHTLVDLYIKQGAKDKALEILNKALELDPSDNKIIEKINAIENEMTKSSGHELLMKMFDDKASKFTDESKDTNESIKMYLNLFLESINKRAKEVLVK